MAYCPKCGNEVRDDMVFCPKCGAPLKVQQTSTATVRSARYRNEKAEKDEKQEKTEKTEKHEKGEHAFIGPLIGGLILVFIGLSFYLETTGLVSRPVTGALFLVIVGVLIMFGAIYGARLASRRHPRT
jgi:uncharacterized membrane protein YvbJ